NESHVAPGDALAIINYINAGLPTAIGPNSQIGQPYGFLDVTGDDNVAPGDALEIINAINAGQGGEGEGIESGVGHVAASANNSQPSIAMHDDWTDLIALLALDTVQRHAPRRNPR